MSIAEEIKKLDELRANGSITEEEYEKAKKSLLIQNETAGEKIRNATGKISKDENMWGMFIHFAQFLGYIIPFAGFITPIIFVANKEKRVRGYR